MNWRLDKSWGGKGGGIRVWRTRGIKIGGGQTLVMGMDGAGMTREGDENEMGEKNKVVGGNEKRGAPCLENHTNH